MSGVPLQEPGCAAGQTPEDMPDFFRRFFEQMPEGQQQRPPRQQRHTAPGPG